MDREKNGVNLLQCPDAAAGGGARRVLGEPGCGAAGTLLGRQAGGGEGKGASAIVVTGD